MIDFTALIHEQHRISQDFFTRNGDTLNALAEQIISSIMHGHKLLICGNGGSACDAMHIAGEFVGRFKCERKGLPAIALSADSGILTALGNDYGFERIFARQVEALGHKGDVLITLSTSGSSLNIVKALQAAQDQGLHCALLTGTKGRERAETLPFGMVVDSVDTARIQECSMTALHLLAEVVEARIMAA